MPTATKLAEPTIRNLRRFIRERPDTIKRDGLFIETRRNIRELKQTDDKRIEGYAIVWDVLSENLGYFREKVKSSACDKDLAASKDIRAFFNHDAGQVLGRTAAGTLRLKKDNIGLAIDVDIPETTFGNDLRISMKRGDINQMSFGFYVREDEFERDTFGEEDPDKWGYLRTLIDIELIEVSVVSVPAYNQTSAYVRSIEGARKEELKRLREIMIRDRQIESIRLRHR